MRMRSAPSVQHALDLKRVMERKGIDPDVGAYTAILAVAARHRDAAAAGNLVEEMRQRGVALDSGAYCALLSAHARASTSTSTADAADAWNAMRAEGIERNEPCVRAFVDACARAAYLDIAFEAVVELAKSRAASGHPLPEPRTWNRLIAACGRARRPGHVERVPVLMRQHGCRVGADTRAFLAEAYGRCGDPARALRLVEDHARRHQTNPTAEEALACVRACRESKRWDLSDAAFAMLEGAGVLDRYARARARASGAAMPEHGTPVAIPRSVGPMGARVHSLAIAANPPRALQRPS